MLNSQFAIAIHWYTGFNVGSDDFAKQLWQAHTAQNIDYSSTCKRQAQLTISATFRKILRQTS